MLVASACHAQSTSDLISGIAGRLANGAQNGARVVAYQANKASSIARTVQQRLDDRISVMDFGAGAGGDVSSAFQNAVNALPAAGGIIDVPDGAYTVNTAPTWGSKSVTWNFSPNAVITGTQTTFPRMATNGGIPAVGPFTQSQSAVVSPAGDATCVMCVESLPPSSLNGGVIASYAGTSLKGSGANAIATAQNLVATAQSGSSGNIWGQEIDVGMYATTGTGTQFGTSYNGLGTGNPTFGIKFQRGDSSLWQTAIDIRNAITAVLIENTTGLTNGLVVGQIPTIYPGTTAMIGQLQNSGSALFLQRYTNTSPSGYLINAVNANNSAQLYSVDVNGAEFAAGGVTTPTVQVTGAAASVSSGRLSLGAQTAASATAGSVAMCSPIAGYLQAYLGSTLIKIPYCNN